MPSITELRCRSCTVLGGSTVRTQEEADAIAAFPFVRIAVAEGRMRPIKLDEFVELRPCITDEGELEGYRTAHERGERPHPCPRVELDAQNGEAAELFGVAINEEARGLAPAIAAHSLRDLSPDEQLRILRRVTRALGDEGICAARDRIRREAMAAARKK